MSFEVRKSTQFGREDHWVVDDGEVDGFINAFGELIPAYVDYPNKRSAQAALDLYLSKQPCVKPTNPKDALGIKKAPLSTVPMQVVYRIGLAMLEGARKYGRHNYRSMGVKASVYFDAMQRHINVWWEGEDIDPDSGLNHIDKAMACLTVLRDSMLMGNWVDDRPIKHWAGLDLQALNEQAKQIIVKYPDCKEPFVEKSDRDEPIPGGY